MNVEIKEKLYAALLNYHNQIKENELELEKYKILLNSDNTTFDYKIMQPDENFWIKPAYPSNKDFKYDYYQEQISNLEEIIKSLNYKYGKLKEKLNINNDIYDRIFYYKYLEEYSYKELLKKVPYSESRFNDYYKIVRKIAEK